MKELAAESGMSIPEAAKTAESAVAGTAPSKQRREYVVGKVAEYPQGSHKVMKVAGREIGIFNIRGQFYGLPNICPHQGGPLCESGKLIGTLIATKETGWKQQWIYDGEVIQCPWHGLEYHVPTGQCLALRALRLRRYEVVVDGEEVKVRI